MNCCVEMIMAGAIIIYGFYWLATWNNNYWRKRGFPHLKPFPFFGTKEYLEFILGYKSFAENNSSIYKTFENESFVGILQFFKPFLFLRDPELIMKVLITDFTHFQDRDFFQMDEKLEPLEYSLFRLTGEKWKTTRSKLSPAFTPNKMKLMFGVIKRGCENTMHFLKKNIGKEFDARDTMTKHELNIIASLTFGIKIDALHEHNNENIEFVDACNKYFNASIIILMKLLLGLTFPRMRILLRIKFTDQVVDKYFINLIKDVIKNREENGIRRKDFLQLMLDLKNKKIPTAAHTSHTSEQENHSKGENNIVYESDDDTKNYFKQENVATSNESVITDNCICANAFSFLTISTNLTAPTFSFLLYELAKNPSIQTQLQDEVDSIMSEGTFNFESLKEMVFAERFIYEVTRLHGNEFLLRTCTKDYRIPSTNLVIEKGTKVIIPVHSLHTDPKYFPHPEKFDPNRFKDMTTIQKGTFIPFGDGPRMCIAIRLVMMELKIFLASLLSQFSVVLSERTKLPLIMNKRSFVQHVIGGIWVRFEERVKL